MARHWGRAVRWDDGATGVATIAHWNDVLEPVEPVTLWRNVWRRQDGAELAGARVS